MKTLSFALICAALITLGAGALADTDKDAATLNQIGGHRQWKRVNPDPVEVPVPVTTSDGTVAINPAVLS